MLQEAFHHFTLCFNDRHISQKQEQERKSMSNCLTSNSGDTGGKVC